MLSKEFKVGLLALIAGVILYVGFNFLKGIELLSSSNKYYVFYDRIDGLQESNSVLINGMPVGRVSTIEILQQENNRLKVTLDVEDHIQLGKGTKAVLADDGLIGGKVIQLIVSNNNDLLESGDSLISESEKGLMQEMQDKAFPILANFDSTLFILNKIVKEYEGMGPKVQNIMDNVETSTSTMNAIMLENRQKLSGILTTVDRLSKSLEQTEKQLKPILANAKSLTDSLKAAPIKSLISETQATLKEVRASVESLNQGQGTMGKIMKDDSLYTNMNQTIQDLDSLFIDLREHPKRYVHFSLFGKKDKAEQKK